VCLIVTGLEHICSTHHNGPGPSHTLQYISNRNTCWFIIPPPKKNSGMSHVQIALTINVYMQVGEFEFYRNQLWTAPELLRMTTRPINGTQKADVYSFAIILQEIMFREEPYFINVNPPQCMRRTCNLIICVAFGMFFV